MLDSEIIDSKKIIDQVVQLSIDAGDEILRHYHTDVRVERKPNNSPVTVADKSANEIIVSGLQHITPSIPIASEELEMPEYSERSLWSHYWLIDPLDGTNSFLRKDDEFTVNIALIKGKSAITGVVHSPVEKRTYWGIAGDGAYCKEGNDVRTIRVREFSGDFVRIIVPTTRGNKQADKFIANLQNNSFQCDVKHSSSSIKFCRVAEGAVDIFPGFRPTSEWDTAAAQCVLESAGGKVVDFDGNSVIYNKTDLENPGFLAFGGGEIDWLKFL